MTSRGIEAARMNDAPLVVTRHVRCTSLTFRAVGLGRIYRVHAQLSEWGGESAALVRIKRPDGNPILQWMIAGNHPVWWPDDMWKRLAREEDTIRVPDGGVVQVLSSLPIDVILDTRGLVTDDAHQVPYDVGDVWPPAPPPKRPDLLTSLREQRETMSKYLDLRRSLEDWHGVQDAASDIREIEAKIAVLNELAKEIG